jgi:hypothetical protein
MQKLAIALAAGLVCSAAKATTFDDCVLENMRGVTSDLAAKSIKVSCLRKSSVPLPDEDLAKLVSQAQYASLGEKEGTGFWISVDNRTDYVITEITIKVSVKGGPAEIFRTDDFWYPTPGVIYTSLPPDPTHSMQIKPFSKTVYQVRAKLDMDVRKPEFKWGIQSAKGIPTR